MTECNHCKKTIHIDAISGGLPSRKCLYCNKKFDKQCWKRVLESYKKKEKDQLLYKKNMFIYFGGNRNSLLSLLLFPIMYPLYYLYRFLVLFVRLISKIIKYAFIILIILLGLKFFFGIDILNKIKEFF